jgi:hypothetical protein
LAALAVAAGVVAYAAAAADRLPEVVAAVGCAGCALIAFGLASRWTSAFPAGVAGVAAAYAVFISVRNGDVDSRSPVVAAAVFAVAELGFWSLERTRTHSERAVLVRRIAGLAGGVALTALIGSVVLVLATGASGGVGLEAAGVLAAILAVAAVTRVVSRASV